jgi:glucose-1-phosphate cytidylyltransferase
MKVAILAGGKGTRLAGGARDVPKPLQPIGGRPILWHVMKHYAHYGFRDFVLAAGHRGEAIAEWAAAATREESWRIQVVDTGLETPTAGRILQLAPVLGQNPFMLTWSDGLSDMDLNALRDFHLRHGRLATVTAVHPPPRFGHLRLEGTEVKEVAEKQPEKEAWINGAFFVLEPGALSYIRDDSEAWENGPMDQLARDRQLQAYRHESFWACMDTPCDWQRLESMWQAGAAPWKVWS